MPIYADEPTPPPLPWYKDLGSGLVFHYRPEYDNYNINSFSQGTPTEFKAQGYPRTGLYQDGVLLYVVTEPIFGSLYFSNDGMSFLEVEWWVPASGDPSVATNDREPIWPAVRFFDQGKLEHYFEVFDLVSNQRSLAFSVSHVQWDYQHERYHNRESDTLQVTTRDGAIITFDISTGTIIDIRNEKNKMFWIVILLIVIAISASVLTFVKYRHSKIKGMCSSKK